MRSAHCPYEWVSGRGRFGGMPGKHAGLVGVTRYYLIRSKARTREGVPAKPPDVTLFVARLSLLLIILVDQQKILKPGVVPVDW